MTRRIRILAAVLGALFVAGIAYSEYLERWHREQAVFDPWSHEKR